MTYKVTDPELLRKALKACAGQEEEQLTAYVKQKYNLESKGSV